MKLKDWDRPVIINEMVNIYSFQYYLNEGQTYRYKKLLPRIISKSFIISVDNIESNKLSLFLKLVYCKIISILK